MRALYSPQLRRWVGEVLPSLALEPINCVKHYSRLKISPLHCMRFIFLKNLVYKSNQFLPTREVGLSKEI